MISHGGSGAMLGAIAAGVPILAIPQGADQFMNAARIVEAGLGLRILPDELGPDVRPDSALDPARRRTVRGDGRRLPGGRRVDAAAGRRRRGPGPAGRRRIAGSRQPGG